MFHVRLLRRALFALPLVLPALPALADAPSFDAYDCSASRSEVRNRHIGQVIEGSYREWTEAYANTKTGRSIYCVTTLRPDSTALTRAQAEDLFATSSAITITVDANTAKAVSTPESQSGVSATLPRGIEIGAATGSEPLTATAIQGLNIKGTGDNAVLDLGFPKPVVVEKKSAAVEKPATIGTDDRIRVNDLTGQPWSFVGQLIVTWKDGTQSACTGTLVSQYVVLTAGQCAHNRDKGGFAARATFAPGQIQQTVNGPVAQPNGARVADYVETNSRWTQVSGSETIQTIDSRSDFAAYYFATPWTFTSTFMPIVYGDSTEGVVNAAGYPVDAGGGTSFNQGLWYSSGLETTRSKNTFRAFQVREFSVDVSAGQNGGPFWSYDGTNRNLLGVISYGGDEVAGGVWFTNDNKAAVTALVMWMPTQSAPSHVADDLHVPLVYPSNYGPAQGYFRFYNPTPQKGAVTVTLADGNTGSQIGIWRSADIAPFGSIQVSVAEVEGGSIPTVNPAGRDRYTINVASNFLGYFQYVLFNPQSGWITNVSGCSNGLSSDVLHLNNVHTSLIVEYPSAIIVHNTGAKAGSAIVGVYATATGTRLGGVIVPNVPSGANAVFSIKDAESVLGIKPGPTEGHYNLVMESDFQGYMQHILYNTRTGVLANLTPKCAMPVH